MTTRALPCLILALAALALVACNDDPEFDTTRITASDPLGDLVALDGHLFATNEDRSGNAGSQVDLFKFTTDGFPVNRFDLGINHVGYLAAATDGESVYLQARDTGQLFKATPVGEIAWTRSDPFSGGGRLACGIAYRADLDSFEVVYRHPGTTAYTTLRYGPGFAGESSEPRDRDWPVFDPDRGVKAVAWADGWLWALGPDLDGEAVVQGFGDDGGATRFFTLPDNSACGLAAAGDTLWVAYPDRRFEPIDLSAKGP